MMLPLTASRLIKLYDIPTQRAVIWQPHLEAAMIRFDIVTLARAAAFLAQIGHESGGLRYIKEIWKNTPAQQSYEMATRLGNTEPGDGERFMGRGPPQITGRRNYTLLSAALGVDFVSQPHLLERVDYGALSAGWFWKYGAGLNLGRAARAALEKHGMGDGVNLNDLADRGDFEAITYCINGGLNGQDHRIDLHKRALDVLGVTPSHEGDPIRWEESP